MGQCCAWVRSLLKTLLVIGFIDSCLLLTGDECSVAKAEHNWTSHEEEEVSDVDEEDVGDDAEDVRTNFTEAISSGEGDDEPTEDGKISCVTTKPLRKSE